MIVHDQRFRAAIRFFALLAFAASHFLLPSAAAQTTVHQPIGHDVSKALREMPAIPPQWDNMNEHPVKPIPHASTGGKDTVLQTKTGISAATVSGVAAFDGVGVTSGYTISGEPPDTNGS